MRGQRSVVLMETQYSSKRELSHTHAVKYSLLALVSFVCYPLFGKFIYRDSLTRVFYYENRKPSHDGARIVHLFIDSTSENVNAFSFKVDW